MNNFYTSGSGTATTGSNYSGAIYIQWGNYAPPPPKPKQVEINPFAAFGVPNGAPLPQIKQRYRELAKILHPDCGGDVKWMAVLNRCYDFLLKGQE